jgi:hypothetical protein
MEVDIELQSFRSATNHYYKTFKTQILTKWINKLQTVMTKKILYLYDSNGSVR